MEHWEHFSHQADIGIRGIGSTREKAFEQAAIALTAVVSEPGSVRDDVRVEIRCEGQDDDMLFVDWINALVYEMDARKLLFSRFEVRATSKGIDGTAWGEPVDPEKHVPVVEVKAATYTCLEVKQVSSGKWTAQCVVDV